MAAYVHNACRRRGRDGGLTTVKKNVKFPSSRNINDDGNVMATLVLAGPEAFWYIQLTITRRTLKNPPLDAVGQSSVW